MDVGGFERLDVNTDQTAEVEWGRSHTHTIRRPVGDLTRHSTGLKPSGNGIVVKVNLGLGQNQGFGEVLEQGGGFGNTYS